MELTFLYLALAIAHAQMRRILRDFIANERNTETSCSKVLQPS